MQNKQIDVDRIFDKMENRIKFILQKNANSASGLASRIDALSPLKVMARGFSAVSKDNKYMTNIDKLNVGDNITVEFYDGNIDCTITDKKCK